MAGPAIRAGKMEKEWKNGENRMWRTIKVRKSGWLEQSGRWEEEAEIRAAGGSD